MKNLLKDEEIIEALNQRYAVKKFDSNKTIGTEKEELIKDILQLTPTSFGLQLYKFIIVKDKKIREKLREASWGQSQITDSDFVIVFCVHNKITRKNLEQHTLNTQVIRETSDEERDGFTDFMDKTILQSESLDALKDSEEWQAKQAYIALGNLMTSASLAGIDTCPIEGMDCKKYNEILGLEKLGLKSKVVLAVGIRSDDDDYQFKKKVRYSKEELFLEM